MPNSKIQIYDPTASRLQPLLEQYRMTIPPGKIVCVRLVILLRFYQKNSNN
jgi:hypothetical protein